MIIAKLSDYDSLKFSCKPDNAVLYTVQGEDYYLGRGTYDKKYIGGDLKLELEYYYAIKIKIIDNIINIFDDDTYLISFDGKDQVLDKVKYIPECFNLKYCRDLKEVHLWQLLVELDLDSIEGRKVLMKNYFDDSNIYGHSIYKNLVTPTKIMDTTFCFENTPGKNEFVPLDKVVGLYNPSYAGESWVNIFYDLKHSGPIYESLTNIKYYDDIQTMGGIPKELEFTKIDDEYYVSSGAHRVTIAKLKGIKEIYAPVSYYKTSKFHKDYYNKLINLGFKVNLCGDDHTYYNILTGCNYKYDWQVFEVSLGNESILLFNENMISEFYSSFVNLDVSDKAIKFREYLKGFKKVYNLLFSQKYSDTDEAWYDKYVTSAIENFFMNNNKMISNHKKELE